MVRIRNKLTYTGEIMALSQVGSPASLAPWARTAERRNESAQPHVPPLRPSAPRPSARRSQRREKIVAIWNARQAGGRALWFYPTIGAAIAAGVPWLTFSCPACQQVGAIDLRTLDRHPGASISSLIPSVSCRRCSPNAPFATARNVDGGTAVTSSVNRLT